MLYPQYRTWRTQGIQDREGVLVATDVTQEWLLPWWWDHYSKHNHHPVAFVNFGMSDEKKAWCRERGEFIDLRVADVFVAESKEVDPQLVKKWEAQFAKQFWGRRNAWFKKPLAFLQSPWRRTLWFDLDCEIRGSVAPLFSFAQPSGIALSREPEESLPYPMYNSGVVAFRHALPIIEAWANACFEKNGEFRGDQDVLAYLLSQAKMPVGEIPREANWLRFYGPNPNAWIFHWHGDWGHRVIRHQLMSAAYP